MSTVAEWVTQLQNLTRVPAELPARVVGDIDAAACASAAAGTTPAGDAWEPKKDGGRPLTGAAGELAVSADASSVRVSLNGPSAIHHNGEARGPRRQVIPDDGEVPDAYARAVDAAFAEAVR